MSTRVLILGAHGQLGHELARVWADRVARGEDAQVVALGRETCDITDEASLRAVFTGSFGGASPTLVYNAAAYNLVDQAEEDRDAALQLNAVAPGRIAAQCRAHDARFVHFSTDYVFGDGHDTPIDESYAPAPLSVYGRSKLLGEQLALQNNPQTFVMRCCGLYSARRSNFIHTMLRHGLRGRPLTVVSDQLVSPTHVAPLAEVAAALGQTELFGVYHAVAHGACSWFTYAQRIFDLLDLDVDLSPVSQDDWGAAAPRPTYSALDNAMLRAVGLDAFRSWEEELELFLVKHRDALLARHTP